MKNLFGLLFLIFTVSILQSCNEEVELSGDFKETAVVHGLLNQADTVHFIKINRAFIGPGDALQIAQIPDSSYFSDVNATVSEVVNGSVIRYWNLVDTLVDNKESGAFFSPTQKLYYFHTIGQSGLNENATYKLRIEINGGEIVVEGETELVKGMTTTISPTNSPFKFYDNQGNYVTQGIPLSNTGTAYVVNCQMEVNFKEIQGTTATPKQFRWQLGEADVNPNTNKNFNAPGQTFYQLLASNCTSDPLIEKRTLESVAIEFTGGSQELYNYMSVNKPTSSLAQNKPSYTNLTVTGDARVIGIFSSRYTLRVEKPVYILNQQNVRAIDKNSTRQLCIGAITGSLLFCSQHIGDQTESWYCF